MSALLPDDFLSELRVRTPIVSVVSRRVPLKKSGRLWEACCPFHTEKTPSFKVHDDPADQHFHCHGCGAHGDAISFVMRSQSIDFRAAVSQLAAEAGMTVPEPAETPQQAQRKARADLMAQVAVTFSHALRSGTGGKDARTYLAGRGLSEETVETWDIGYAPPNATFADYGVSLEQAVDLGLATQTDEGKAPRPLFHNRIMFPVRDIRGRIIGFSGRALTDRQQPKYLNSYGFDRSRALFGIDKAAPAVKAGSPMLVVEGQMDVLTLHQAGICGAVAPMGTAVTPEQLEEMWRLCPRPVYCADGDEAGRRATARLVNLVLPSFDATRSLAFAHLPDGSDPDSYVRKHGPGAFCGLVGRATPFSDAAYAVMRSRFRAAADPASRTAFREHINQTAATIHNGIMASECRSYWTTRFFQDRRTPGRPVAAPPCDPPASLTEHARVLRSLETQIVEASEAFAADSTPQAEKRLRLLVQERNRIRRDGVGEAVTEGTEEIDA